MNLKCKRGINRPFWPIDDGPKVQHLTNVRFSYRHPHHHPDLSIPNPTTLPPMVDHKNSICSCHTQVCQGRLVETSSSSSWECAPLANLECVCMSGPCVPLLYHPLHHPLNRLLFLLLLRPQTFGISWWCWIVIGDSMLHGLSQLFDPLIKDFINLKAMSQWALRGFMDDWWIHLDGLWWWDGSFQIIFPSPNFPNRAHIPSPQTPAPHLTIHMHPNTYSLRISPNWALVCVAGASAVGVYCHDLVQTLLRLTNGPSESTVPSFPAKHFEMIASLWRGVNGMGWWYWGWGGMGSSLGKCEWVDEEALGWWWVY